VQPSTKSCIMKLLRRRTGHRERWGESASHVSTLQCLHQMTREPRRLQRSKIKEFALPDAGANNSEKTPQNVSKTPFDRKHLTRQLAESKSIEIVAAFSDSGGPDVTGKRGARHGALQGRQERIGPVASQMVEITIACAPQSFSKIWVKIESLGKKQGSSCVRLGDVGAISQFLKPKTPQLPSDRKIP